MEWVYFLGAIGPGLLFMIFAWYYRAFPPKSINFMYGYRTWKSMRNQESWDFGNKMGAKMMFFVGMYTVLAGTVAYFISPPWSFGISIFFLVVAVFIGIFWCERLLADNFDAKGKRIPKRGKTN